MWDCIWDCPAAGSGLELLVVNGCGFTVARRIGWSPEDGPILKDPGDGAGFVAAKLSVRRSNSLAQSVCIMRRPGVFVWGGSVALELLKRQKIRRFSNRPFLSDDSAKQR